MNLSRKILLATAAAAAMSAMASAALAQNTANASVAINAKIIAPITITAGTALNFGTVFTNASAQTVTIDTAGARGGTATALGSSGHTAATFTVGGTDGQLFDASYAVAGLPANFTVGSFVTSGCGATNAAGSPVTALTTSTSTCSLAIGGTLSIPAGAAAQSVNGTLTTTVTYE